jgi:hypothetical protein
MEANIQLGHDYDPQEARKAGLSAASYVLANDLPESVMLELCYELGLKPDPQAKPWTNPRTLSRKRHRARKGKAS